MRALGVYGSWATPQKIVQIIERNLSDYESRWERDLAELRKFAVAANPTSAGVNLAEIAVCASHALSCSSRYQAYATKSILLNDPWSALWLTKYHGYGYWSEFLARFPVSPSGRSSFASSIENLCGCLNLGWIPEAGNAALDIRNAYAKRRLIGTNGHCSNPLYHWIFRICLDHFEIDFDGWGRGFHGDARCNVYSGTECLSEPILNELYAHWRDEDLSPFHEQMIWLCDYYTHRTAHRECTEFGLDFLHIRFPELILAWFRLREARGLLIPQINHPLTRPPYARLAAPQPFYTDELLEAVLDRLRSEGLHGLGVPQWSPVDVAPVKLKEHQKWLRRFWK